MPLWVRSALVPTANIGSSIGYFVMLIGLFLAAANMLLVGAIPFSASWCSRSWRSPWSSTHRTGRRR